MATQQNFAISTPSFAAENASFTLVSEKERKKQQKEAMHLATVLQLIEKELAGAKEEVSLQTPSQAKEGDDPSNTAFDDAMAKMVLALQLLQVHITKFEDKKTGYDAQISQDEVTLAKKNLENLQKQIKKIQKNEKKQKAAQFWEKFADYLVVALSAVLAIITFQPELLIITAVSFAAATGLMKDATNAVASLLEDIPGLSKQAAEIIAAVVVCIAVVAISIAFAPNAAVEEVADTADETASAVDGVASSSEESVEESTSFLDKLKKIGSKLPNNPFKKLSPAGRIGIFSTANSVSSTQLVNNIAEVIMDSQHLSEKHKQQIEEALSITIAIATAILSCGLMTAAAQSGGTIAKSALQLTTKLASAAYYGLIAGNIGEAVAGTIEGIYTIQQGTLEKETAEFNANLQMIRAAMQLNSRQVSEDQQHDAQILNNQKLGDKSISGLMRGEAAFAQLFTQYSPV